METLELLGTIQRGEDTKHQFKKDINNPSSLVAELVAFSNTDGGQLFIGVNDDGTLSPLDAPNVRRINQMLSNDASQGINPAINISTENIAVSNGIIIVATVPNGLSKPYMDKDGIIWVKNGSDKRKATSREEIQRIFQKEGLVHADETEVPNFSYSNIDLKYFSDFFYKEYGKKLEEQSLPLPQLLENMNLVHNGNFDIAGAVLFATDIFFVLPSFIVKAVVFPGYDVSDTNYRDKRELRGKLADIFSQTVSFILMNIPHKQGSQDFNSSAEPLIPRPVIEELVANALVHRDYFVPAAVRVFILSDRVEIISPGHLPNNLTVENIKSGNSVSRNPIIASFASRLIPYSGIGTGILRALKLYPNIDFVDDREKNVFKVVIKF